MKKMLLIAAIGTLLLFSSCARVCRCYHYDSSIVEFSDDELSESNTTCNEMENINLGLSYSLCEYAF